MNYWPGTEIPRSTGNAFDITYSSEPTPVPPPVIKHKPESKTGRLRALLVDGPKTTRELSQLSGISNKRIAAYLQNDMERGVVSQRRDCFPFRYSLVDVSVN